MYSVAREVGTDGRLGGQARVPGVAGTWKVGAVSIDPRSIVIIIPGSDRLREHHGCEPDGASADYRSCYCLFHLVWPTSQADQS